MLPANRLGATRGPNGTTLDDLLEALQANTAAVTALAEGQAAQAGALAAILTGINAIAAAQVGLSAQLGALNLSAGSPADTTCNMSQLELLCAIATQLGLETETPSEPPPVICPGFEAGITWGPLTPINAFFEGNPTPQWYVDFAGMPDTFPFQVVSQAWQDDPAASNITFLRLPGEVGPVSVCITSDPAGDDTQWLWRRFNPDTYAYSGGATLTTYGLTEPLSTTVSVDINSWFTIRATMPTSDPPNARFWLTILP